MSISRIEFSFFILKEIRKELKSWEKEGLDEIKDEDVREIIQLLNVFLTLKEVRDEALH